MVESITVITLLLSALDRIDWQAILECEVYQTESEAQ
jgi:hypothetical protein